MTNSFIKLLTPDFTKIDEVYNILLKQYHPDNIEKTELMFIDSVNFENMQNHEIAEKLNEYLNVKKSKLQYQNIDYFNHYIKTKRFGFTVYYSYTLNKYSFDSKIKAITPVDFQNVLNKRKELYFYIFNKLSEIEKTAFKSKFCDSLEKLKSFQKESFFIELITDLINVIEKDYLNFKKSTEQTQQPEIIKTIKRKKDFKDFFNTNVKIETIQKIENEFKEYYGKKMAVLIYLLETEFKLIKYSLDSKTDSRKHLVDSLNKSKINMQPINKYFVTHTYKLDINNFEKDKDFIKIKENLSKSIE